MGSRAGGRGYPVSEYDERDYYAAPPPRRRPARDYDEPETYIRPPPDFLREDYGRTSAGPLVVIEREQRGGPPPGRDYEEEAELVVRRRKPNREDKEQRRERGPPKEEIIDVEVRRDERPRRRREPEREEIDVEVRREERPKPRRREVEREEVDIEIRREDPRPRDWDKEVSYRRGQRPREVKREEVVIRKEELDPPKLRRRERSFEEIDIDIRRQDRRSKPRPREVSSDEVEIKIREDDRRLPRDTLVLRERSEPPPRMIAREREEFVYRRREPSPPPEREFEEIIIRERREPSPSPPSPSPSPTPPEPALEPITRPPIIQEVITHRRFIDHAPVRAPSSSSSSSASPPPVRRRERELEIDIRRKDARGNVFEEDIRFTTEADPPPPRRVREVEERKVIKQEAPAPAPIPLPRRTREDITINLDLDLATNGPGDRRGVVPVKPRPREMWTEVTKDLVTREAIQAAGYSFDETEDFFYVMEYLRYDDVARLVELSEDLASRRRERIEEIQWERQDPRLQKPRAPQTVIEAPALPPPPRLPQGYDERIYEREVVYEERPRRGYR